MLTSSLWRLVTSTAVMWGFLCLIRDGVSVKRAWETAAVGLSLRTGYRMWQRFRRVESQLRQQLSRLTPPVESDSTRPPVAVIEHLDAAFGGSRCPIDEYQLRMQQGLLAPRDADKIPLIAA
jgi:hypothetical protein